MVEIKRYFRTPGMHLGAHNEVLQKLKMGLQNARVVSMDTEVCFYVVLNKDMSNEDLLKLEWLLTVPFQSDKLLTESQLDNGDRSRLIVEIGPRLNFSTAFSTNAVSMCHSLGLTQVTRLEYSTIYQIEVESLTQHGDCVSTSLEASIVELLLDKMTQCHYEEPVKTFDLNIKSEPVYEANVIKDGRKALDALNKEMGLAFDDWDLDYYTSLFCDKVGRNPTNVECFDLAQSNSEHSRHWFFKGRMVIDGEEESDSLFKMVMNTQQHSNTNNLIKFSDNSSAIAGFPVDLLYPESPEKPSYFQRTNDIKRHIIYTAETHNFPTGVAPFPGATTGTGGRIRDVQATGIGAHVVAGTAGYCFGNLHIPGYELAWEDGSFSYPSNFASPLDIAVQASNGASDYGNKFGEPVITGFARSFGMKLPNGERREWIKPIMFSGGMGSIDHIHVSKDTPQVGMDVVKLGGPVYRIGVGGGAASSVQVQGDNNADLDFGAVQRGDAEMEQKLNRVIRACIERGVGNPITSIHDQGAGGNGNVLKEIVEPAGAIIHVDQFELGDPTISVLELWGAEYQESNAILIQHKDSDILRQICKREKCPVSFVGCITGDKKIRLQDRLYEDSDEPGNKRSKHHYEFPVDLELEHVLGSMPRKVFNLARKAPVLKCLDLPHDLTVMHALHRVLRLPSVASKRYLTNKVDRSVTGLIAQQQCVGPLHTPLADVAVTALSYFNTVGAATAIGEQPIKGLIDPKCGARMSVGEALTNLIFAPITDIKDIKCSANWMWAAKLPGEGAALYDACRAMCTVMSALGIAVDGGKDSLSMAAKAGSETVKAPGSLVVSVYAACTDINATVTPDLKCPTAGREGTLLYIPMGHDNLASSHIGGSALAQCYSQLGDDTPDLCQPDEFVKSFNIVQSLIMDGLISAGHDVSDGGLITCILEMAFAANCGLHINISSTQDDPDPIAFFFGEELGLVVEIMCDNLTIVKERLSSHDISYSKLGYTLGNGPDSQINVVFNSNTLVKETVANLRDIWEETSFKLESLQCNPECVREEREGLKHQTQPPYKASFTALKPRTEIISNAPKVAVIREEGSNGDREMVAAFHMAGFEVWDVTVQDLCKETVYLDRFKGIAFVGGFSYADVLGSAKGWAATLLFNKNVKAQMESFKNREDTFSLGVCNGCQLMALLGWVAPDTEAQGDNQQGLFLDHNKSERYESRFCAVSVEQSASIMFKGMEGSILGIWVAHGEGQMIFKNEKIHTKLVKESLITLKFVENLGQPTTQYPMNPNGSPGGVTGLCSADGRHLAIMPHPERTLLPWQWPWLPYEWQDMKVSPWLQMFHNAYNWCTTHS